MKNSNTGTVIRQVGLGLTVVALVLATGWAWQYTLSQRAAARAAAQERERIPEIQARQEALDAEISKRALDVARIEAFLVSKEQLAQVINEIESLGRQANLEVGIPTVEEKQLFNEQGAPVPPSGPLLDVRLKIVAVGPPKQLLSFLHAIEHMQRLTYFESWRLDASEQAARNQTAVLPTTDNMALPFSGKALLTADMIVAVRATEGGQAP